MEKPPRLVKQFIKLAMGLALVQGHESVGEDEMRILGRVVWDTMPQIRRVVLLQLRGVPEGSLANLCLLTGLPKSTVYWSLQDLALLHFAEGDEDGYRLTKRGADLLSGLWDYQ